VQPVKFARHPAASSQPAEFLQVAPVQDVNGHIGIVANVKAALRLVAREAHRNRRSDRRVGVFADKLLGRIMSANYEAGSWDKTWALRNPTSARCGRNGRSVSRA